MRAGSAKARANARAKTRAKRKEVAAGAAAKPARAKPVVVTALTPSSNGARWTITLSSRAQVRISAAAAHAIRARIGMRWTNATQDRVDEADREHRLFARGLSLLAKGPAPDRATLTRKLGGDALAQRAVRALRASGWLA